ncbi:hypothetical protein RF11_10841 [Thelohanellus kitauei]|uniref:Uncharacterized protein n=1 Tax=Thelohanellus kitauei TaxID=669202 RepID=A0A0C2MQL2_THEKT|nr:hypothetical protein RF11_10841 [Thelohanellus kitauei]
MNSLSICLKNLKSENLQERKTGLLLSNRIDEFCTASDFQEFIEPQILNPNKFLFYSRINTCCYLELIKCATTVFENELDCTNMTSFILVTLEHSDSEVRENAKQAIEKISKSLNYQTNSKLLRGVITLVTKYLKNLYNKQNQFVSDNENILEFQIIEKCFEYLKCLFINWDFCSWREEIPIIVDVFVKCSTNKNHKIRKLMINSVLHLFSHSVLRYINSNDVVRLMDIIYKCLCDDCQEVCQDAYFASVRFVAQINHLGNYISDFKFMPAFCMSRLYFADYYVWVSYLQELCEKEPEEGRKRIGDYINICDQKIQGMSHELREITCNHITKTLYLIRQFVDNHHLDQAYISLLNCSFNDCLPARETAIWALGINVSIHKEYFKDKVRDVMRVLVLLTISLTESTQSLRFVSAFALLYIFNSFPVITFHFLNKFLSHRIGAVTKDTRCFNYETTFSKTAISMIQGSEDTSRFDQPMYIYDYPNKTFVLGCTTHSKPRKSQKWEITEGCLVLLGELAVFYTGNRNFDDHKRVITIQSSHEASVYAKELVRKNLSKIKKVLKVTNIKEHVHIYQLFFSYLPSIRTLVEKNLPQSNTLRLFARELYYGFCLKDSYSPRTAVEYCIKELAKEIGHIKLGMIFRELYGFMNPLSEFLNKLDLDS